MPAVHQLGVPRAGGVEVGLQQHRREDLHNSAVRLRRQQCQLLPAADQHRKRGSDSDEGRSAAEPVHQWRTSGGGVCRLHSRLTARTTASRQPGTVQPAQHPPQLLGAPAALLRGRVRWRGDRAERRQGSAGSQLLRRPAGPPHWQDRRTGAVRSAAAGLLRPRLLHLPRHLPRSPRRVQEEQRLQCGLPAQQRAYLQHPAVHRCQQLLPQQCECDAVRDDRCHSDIILSVPAGGLEKKE